MARRATPHPTDGELEILRVLWAEGPLGLTAVCEQLRTVRDVATTTVATMLRVMLDKKLVKRSGEGRAARWAAAVSRDKAAVGMVQKVVDGVFDGSAQRLVAHLVESQQLDAAELAELRKVIQQASGAKKSGGKKS